jgi:hypothetical protein
VATERETATKGNTGGTATGASAAADYAVGGRVVIEWLNKRLNAHPRPTLELSTKKVTAVAVMPDGRLEYELPDGEHQFAALDDTLLEKITLKVLNM